MSKQGALVALRGQIDELNSKLLELLNQRIEVARQIRAEKRLLGQAVYDPERELQMIGELLECNPGPLPPAIVAHLFREITRTTVEQLEGADQRTLRVARKCGEPDRIFKVGPHLLGEGPVLVSGPCSVESEEQIFKTARFLRSRGVRFLRGGSWKARTSPYEFQGLGRRGLTLLAAAAHESGMASVTEVVDTRHVAEVAQAVDMLQVGARNMQNFELLKELGGCGKPVLLKRGMSATLDELLNAAEYIASHGNQEIALCERGIRTYERQTRNTFDTSAVALLRQMTTLPVLADVSHAAGRKDILAPLARAALAAGAQGVMLEVHPQPEIARSDAQQQLDFPAFDAFLEALEAPLATLDAHVKPPAAMALVGR
ncbi:MAG: aroF2 [Myxococcaceae bacterium]|nr:aroF2 [Myxococcaceae bacterium]